MPEPELELQPELQPELESKPKPEPESDIEQEPDGLHNAKMPSLWRLFWVFAKVGVMTFGGGIAMLPILQREVVEDQGWATDAELTDYYAIGQCTPGIIAVNTATFIGQKEHGIAGGIAATLGVVFPSVVIISLLAGLITSYAELDIMKHAFAGIRACVCVLIFNAILKLWKSSIVDAFTLIIFIAITLLAMLTPISPAIFVLVAAGIGVGIELVRGGTKHNGSARHGETPEHSKPSRQNETPAHSKSSKQNQETQLSKETGALQ